MIRRTEGNKRVVIFNSINEVVKFNREEEMTDFYKSRCESERGSYNFTKTNSYEEAEDLLLHGWDDMAKKLEVKMNKTTYNVGSGYKNKTVYGVQGFQACVPRYLQGMPDAMISSKRIVTKQKVLNIIKDISYACKVKASEIEEESIKVLRLVKDLELKGYRVNLSVCVSLKGNDSTTEIIQVKIKDASQRINIKQMAFPLVHPSMLRRIYFGLCERLPETRNLGWGYGYPQSIETIKSVFKDCYVIPKIIQESEITEIEKYKAV